MFEVTQKNINQELEQQLVEVLHIRVDLLKVPKPEFTAILRWENEILKTEEALQITYSQTR